MVCPVSEKRHQHAGGGRDEQTLLIGGYNNRRD